MVKYVLIDNLQIADQLYPFTLTRAIADCRIGITTIKEKWELLLGEKVSISTQAHLQPLYGLVEVNDNIIYIASHIIPTAELVAEIKKLKPHDQLFFENTIVAFQGNSTQKIATKTSPISIEYPWDLFSKNAVVLASDFALITNGRNSQKLDKNSILIGDENQLFIEEGATINAAIFNTTNGPIYIGKNAEVMEGTIIRGGFALCEGAGTKLATKVYGATTVGPYCKIGGEVNNSILFGYSNKGHDGFLGNSVIGEWCNLGADTNNSNLKNNYGIVKSYSGYEKREISTGLQFCGLMMGDHSKSSINTMFNTGTVCGVSSNIFGNGFPPKHIPSFSWGDERFEFEKAVEAAGRMMERREKFLSEKEVNVLKKIYDNN